VYKINDVIGFLKSTTMNDSLGKCLLFKSKSFYLAAVEWNVQYTYLHPLRTDGLVNQRLNFLKIAIKDSSVL
jgi:hypothetical protein